MIDRLKKLNLLLNKANQNVNQEKFIVFGLTNLFYLTIYYFGLKNCLLGILLNIPVNYLFIYGLWGLPKMGGAGCGWATAIVMTSMMLVLLAYVFLQ